MMKVTFEGPVTLKEFREALSFFTVQQESYISFNDTDDFPWSIKSIEYRNGFIEISVE